MAWNKTEAGIIKEHGISLKIIEKALVGDIETQKPGMIDDISGLKGAMKDNRKQHKLLFSLAGVSVFVILYQGFGGNLTPEVIMTFFNNTIKAIF